MRRRQRAVTLIELMVASAISTVILVSILGIYGLAVRRWNVQASRDLASQQANTALQRLDKVISGAITFNALSVKGNPVFLFTLPNATDSSGTYVPQRQGASLAYRTGTQVRFYLSDKKGTPQTPGGTILWRASLPVGSSQWQPDTEWSLYGSGAARCDNVKSFTLTSAGMPPNTVRLTLTVTEKQGGTVEDYTLTRDILLGNHN